MLHFSYHLLILFYLSFPHSSVATDVLQKGENLKDGQTLISSSKIFEFGFFTPGNSTSRYVGIWYHNISTQTVVWVLNRDQPLEPNHAILTFQNNGNLALVNHRNNSILYWSANISSTKIQINNTGQLFFLSANDTVLWNSFDHPTDTSLPGMTVSLNLKTGAGTQFRAWKSPNDPSSGEYTLGIDPSGSGQFFMWKDGSRRWRSGRWDGNTFRGSTTKPLYLYNQKVIVWNANDSMYYSFPTIGSLRLMFVLGYDGVERIERYDEGTEKWNSIWAQPGNECETYAKCGAFGICRFNGGEAICSCMQGFSFDTYGRCVRRSQLQCEFKSISDGFYEMKSMKVPDKANGGSMLTNEDDCRSECLRNCSCNAYAYVTGIGCLMWGGDLVDTVQFDDDFSRSTLYIKLAASELDNIAATKRNTWSKIVIICASAVSLFILACILLFWNFRFTVQGCFKEEGKSSSTISSRKLSSSGKTDFSKNEEEDSDLPWFNFNTIINATSNFSLSNKLGEGGFGGVFKGTLPGGIEVGVKKLSLNSGQGHQEFKNEMTLIAKLQHRNLVRLIGCCVHEHEKMLIYEYMPNKSLDSFLFNPSKQHLLDWNRRFSIIEGIARGLVYLHRDSRLRIVHRDLKASNILLDVDMNPKISDFGMARIFGNDQNELNTRRIVGTFGYMSPEYAMQGIFSFKSDVYSFGILLLELVSGRRNNSFHHMPNILNIAGYAWKLWDKQRAAEMIDPVILESCSIPQVVQCIQIGLLCVQDRADDRPDMHSIVLMLASDNSTLAIPSAPLFTVKKGPVQTPFFYDREETCSVNNVTITEILAR